MLIVLSTYAVVTGEQKSLKQISLSSVGFVTHLKVWPQLAAQKGLLHITQLFSGYFLKSLFSLVDVYTILSYKLQNM